MATVKGDVHDIGKNIVGVVLGCNNYEVVDLGVMVPCDKILQAAIDQNADIVGLSGLITPSLDEMVFVASEMARRHMTLPLLIGGATTSPQHTAVKVAPAYQEPTVHVPDASRVVDVVASLLNPGLKPAFDAANRATQARLCVQHATRNERPTLTLDRARANRPRLDHAPAVPSFTGARKVDVALEDLVPFIDWQFFFTAWELKGRFPALLTDPKVGAAATELYNHAQVLLKQIVDGKRLRARGVYGFWKANADGDDIVLYTSRRGGSVDPRDGNPSRRGGSLDPPAPEIARFPMLRQQEAIADDKPNRSLADFVAPVGSVTDYVGAFAVSAGHGVDELVKTFEAAHDDYSAIMVKALADRLAEAFAEYLHAQARKDWGLDDSLSNNELIDEKYRGIRPAFGYPACPDHTEKARLFDLLGARSVGLDLTESFAMTPAASVSGLYFSHPGAKYFNIQRVGLDQVEDYARRKNMTVADVERWLRPVLSYEPSLVTA